MTQLLMRRRDLEGLLEVSLPRGLALRESVPEDAPALALLLRSSFEDDRWTEERVRSSLTEAPDVARTFVIADGTTLLATASARLLPEQYPGSGYVHWVAASPASRGQRLGYWVSLAVLHEFVRLGCRNAVLETDDFRLPAIKTYLNLGFGPVHRDETHPARWAVSLERLTSAVR